MAQEVTKIFSGGRGGGGGGGGCDLKNKLLFLN